VYSTGVFRPVIVPTAFLLAVSYWIRAPTRPALTTSLGGKIHWRMIVAREASAFRSTRKNSYPVVIGGSRGNGPPGTYGSCRITAFPYNSIAEDCSLARASSPPSALPEHVDASALDRPPELREKSLDRTAARPQACACRRHSPLEVPDAGSTLALREAAHERSGGRARSRAVASIGSHPSRMRRTRSTRFGGTTLRTILTELSRGSALGNTLWERWQPPRTHPGSGQKTRTSHLVMASALSGAQAHSAEPRFRALLTVSEAIVSHRDLSALFHELAGRFHLVVRNRSSAHATILLWETFRPPAARTSVFR
jgi:hypothetical protein